MGLIADVWKWFPHISRTMSKGVSSPPSVKAPVVPVAPPCSQPLAGWPADTVPSVDESYMQIVSRFHGNFVYSGPSYANHWSGQSRRQRSSLAHQTQTKHS